MAYLKSMVDNSGVQAQIVRISPTPELQELFLKVFKKIEEYGMKIVDFDCTEKDFCFNYKTVGRNTLNYGELLELQQLVNPKIDHIDYISVFGMDGIYTIRVKFEY